MGRLFPASFLARGKAVQKTDCNQIPLDSPIPSANGCTTPASQPVSPRRARPRDSAHPAALERGYDSDYYIKTAAADVRSARAKLENNLPVQSLPDSLETLKPATVRASRSVN